MTLIYTTYMTEPNQSPYLRNFVALFGRGDVPNAKFTHTFFDEVPVEEAPAVCTENTTLESPVLIDRFDTGSRSFVLEQFSGDSPHHVHLKFDLPLAVLRELIGSLPYDNLLIQQNLKKRPRSRLIATVILPHVPATAVIGHARELPGYAGAVADRLLVDHL